MRRALLLALALLAGIIAGEYLTTNFAFRAALGRLVRREELRALVGRRGIYEHDATSAIADAKVAQAAAGEVVSEAAIGHEMDLLRGQLPNEKAWDTLLAAAGLSQPDLRAMVATNLRGRAWLEAKLAVDESPSETELRQFYETHVAAFQEPLRFRASHLFLAAPEGYPEEVIENKRTLIEALAAQLKNGEPFPTLVAQYSEDAATKEIGGDMNYFAEARMLPAVWESAQTLAPGATSAPIHSRLGFHLLRLTDRRTARLLTFEEARPEILTFLENERRSVALAGLVATLDGR